MTPENEHLEDIEALFGALATHLLGDQDGTDLLSTLHNLYTDLVQDLRGPK